MVEIQLVLDFKSAINKFLLFFLKIADSETAC